MLPIGHLNSLIANLLISSLVVSRKLPRLSPVIQNALDRFFCIKTFLIETGLRLSFVGLKNVRYW